MRRRSLLAILVAVPFIGSGALLPEVLPPEIRSGQWWEEDLYFTDIDELVSEFVDPTFGLDAQGLYTLNACAGGCPSGTDCATGATWHDAQVESGLGDLTTPFDGAEGTYVALSSLDDGRFVVAEQRWGGTYWEVWLRVLDAEGNPVASPFRADPGIGDQRQPRVAGLSADTFAVVWTAPDADDLGVWAAVFTAGGSVVRGPFEVPQRSAGRQHLPDVAATAGGGFAVSFTTNWDPSLSPWYDEDPRGRGLDLSIRAFDGSGGSPSPERDLTEIVTEHESWAALTTRPGGGVAAIWRSAVGQPPDQQDLELVLRDVDDGGNPGVGTMIAETGALGHVRYLDVAAAPDGQSYAATWEADGGAGRLGWLKIFDDRFVSMGSPLRLEGADLGHRPAVTFLDETTLAVTWATLADSGIGEVWVQAFAVDPTGPTPLAPPVRVDDGGSWVAAPSIVANADGTALVAWSARSSAQGASRVLARALTPRGTLVASPVPHANADIDVQFKWIDAWGTERCSELRHWFWANPDAASSGYADYPDLDTNALDLPVQGAWSPGPESQILEVRLASRTAPLLGGTCDPWSPWEQSSQAFPAALDAMAVPDLSPDTTCFQYQWRVTNRARVTWEHGSPNVVRADRVPPMCTFDSQVEHDLLHVWLGCDDVHGGCDPTGAVRIADGPAQPVPSRGESWLEGLIDGPQFVEATVRDLAGNDDVRRDVVVADLALPGIDILSIDEGGLYGPDIPLLWVVTGGVEDLSLAVDGTTVPLADELRSLAEGPHEVVLSGVSPEGEPVEDRVGFLVDPDVLTVVITAPTPALHPDDDLTAAAWVSDPSARLQWSLDGSTWQASPVFEDMADGAHTLAVKARAAGRAGRDEVVFTSEDIVPELWIEAPTQDEVVGSGFVQVLCWSSVGDVGWEVGGRSGTAACGERLPNDGGDPLPDGEHVLVLTAEHDNGNVAREAVTFTVDARPFDLVVTSPVGGAYGEGEIALAWETTTEATVTATLDGQVVTELSGLAPGDHELVVHAEGQTGAEDTEVVRFTVVPLAIERPMQGEEVVSTGLPALVPLRYSGGEACASLTATLDDEDPVGIVAGPGEPVDLATTRGEHTLRLTCHVGTDAITDVVDFIVGERNITPETIRYAYDNCTEAWDCDVTVTAVVRNTGDFDVRDPFDVRFDHLDVSGKPVGSAQWGIAPALRVGELAEVVFAPVRASLEHRFTVFVDPDQEIPQQTLDDDYAEVRFFAGSIHEPDWVHDAQHFLSGASFTNGVRVETSGPVSRVEVTAGGRTFVDSTPEGDTWHLLSDMGDLTPDDDCVDVAAVSVDGAVIDAATFCPDVSETTLAPRGHVFPWYRFARTDGHLHMEDLDRAELAEAAVIAHRDTATANLAPMLPVITENGEVAYLFTGVGGVPASANMIDMGDGPFGGQWMAPTQTAMFSVLVNPTAGTCSASGVLFTDSAGITHTWEDAAEDYLESQAAQALDGVDISELIEQLAPGYWYVGDLPFGTDNFLFAGAVPPIDEAYGFGLYTLGILDLSLSLPEVEIDMLVDDVIRGGFDITDLCALSLGGPTLGVNVEARLWAEAESNVNLRIGAQHAELFALGLPHWQWVPIPVLVGVVHAELEVHPQELEIPIETGFEMTLQLSPFAPDPMGITARAQTVLGMQHGMAPLADLSYTAYPLIGLGFGGGQDIRFSWMIDSYFALAAESGYDFTQRRMNPVEAGAETRLMVGLDTEKRTRVCLLGIICWWGDWSAPDEQNQCHDYAAGDDMDFDDPCPCPDSDNPEAPLDRTCFLGPQSLPF